MDTIKDYIHGLIFKMLEEKGIEVTKLGTFNVSDNRLNIALRLPHHALKDPILYEKGAQQVVDFITKGVDESKKDGKKRILNDFYAHETFRFINEKGEEEYKVHFSLGFAAPEDHHISISIPEIAFSEDAPRYITLMPSLFPSSI
jgi:hypothetical protein